MIYVTSDLHGYDLDLFLDFLKRSDFDGERDRLIVLGDVIDGNGDGGVSLLRWMMNKPFATLLRGIFPYTDTSSISVVILSFSNGES